MKDYEAFYNKYDRYIKIVEHRENSESSIHNHLDVDYTLAKEELSEHELKILVIYSTFKRCIGSGDAEMMDIAESILNELKSMSLDIPASTEFIKSLFNIIIRLISYKVHLITHPVLVVYHSTWVNNTNTNILKTRPKNFTHPILVRKSYRYLGTPPLIADKKVKHIASLTTKIKVWLVV